MSLRIVDILSGGAVIPVVRTMDDFQFAMAHAVAPSIMQLFGDITSLPQILAQAKHSNKRIILHADLFEGISRDKAGIKFLSRTGITALATTKSQLVKLAREEGMIAIQRLFLVDSESLKTGLQVLRRCKPDIIEIMPAYSSAESIAMLAQETGLPIIAGGFLCTEEDVLYALRNGAYAVSSSSRILWRGFLRASAGF